MIHKLTLNGQNITLSGEKKGYDINWKVDWASISEKEAQELQQKAGYPPAGYGFYKFAGNRWQSASSCD